MDVHTVTSSDTIPNYSHRGSLKTNKNVYGFLYINPILNSLSGTIAVALEQGASADITWECKK